MGLLLPIIDWGNLGMPGPARAPPTAGLMLFWRAPLTAALRLFWNIMPVLGGILVMILVG